MKLNINSSTAIGTGTLIIKRGGIDNTSGGAITLTNNNAQQWNGSFTFTGASSLNMGTGAVTLGTANPTVTAVANTLTVGGAIGDGGLAYGFTKDGVGTLVLGGTDTYTGATTLNAGTLTVNSGATLSGATAPLVVSNPNTGAGTTVSLNLNSAQTVGSLSGTIATPGSGTNVAQINLTGAVLTVNQTAANSFAGKLTGTGGLALGSGSTQSLALSGANTYTGGTTVSAGTLTFLNTTAKPSSGTHAFAAGTTLGLGVSGTNPFTSTDVDNAFSGTMTGNLSGITVTSTTGVGIDTTNGDFSYNTSVAGSPTKGLAKLGANTLTLTGTNTYTGPTTINAGTLSVGTSANLGGSASNLVFNGGTLQVTGTTLTNFSGIGHTVSFTAAKLVGLDINNAANTFTVDQVLNQTTGGFTKAGAGMAILNQANTYTGATTVSAGTLQAGVASVTGASGAFGVNSAVTLANVAGVVLDLNNFSTQIGSLATGGSTGGNVTLGSATLTTGGDNTTTIYSGAISGTGGGVTKNGTGTFTLNGAAANTYTGATTVNGGTLIVDFANAATATDLINSGSALALGGGTLQVKQKTATVTSQTFASTAVNAGASSVTGTSIDATGFTLALGSFSRASSSGIAIGSGGSGGTLNFTLPTSGSITTSTVNTNGIIGTWATTGSGTSLKYATSGASGTNPITALTGTTAATAAALTDTTGAVNYDLNTATGTVQATVSANTIRYTAGAATTAPGGTSFTVNGLMNAGTGTWTIGTNPIKIGANRELVILSNTQGLTITSVIADGTGKSALTYNGGGTLALNALNTYTGDTTVLAGAMTSNTNNAIKGNLIVGSVGGGGPAATFNSGVVADYSFNSAHTTNATVYSNGTLYIRNPTTGQLNNLTIVGGTVLQSYAYINGTVTMTGGTLGMQTAGSTGAIASGFGAVTTLASASTATISANIGYGYTTYNVADGAAAIDLLQSGAKSGSGAVTKTGAGLMQMSGASTYAGATAVSGGTLQAGVASNPGVNGAFGLNSAVTLANTAGVVLDLNNFNTQIGSLATGGSTGGNVTLGTATLTTGGNNTNTSYAGVISGSGGVTKIGTGVQTLTGASTYAGTTTVQAGSLVAGVSDVASTSGAFGNASSAIVLGNGSTALNDAPSVLINGGSTVARNITVGSVVDNGVAYKATIGGLDTSGTSTFTGNITLNTTADSYTFTLQAATGGTVEFKTGTWSNAGNKAISIGSAGNTGTVKVSNASSSLATTAATGITVNYGTLQAGASTLFSSSTPLNVSGGTFDLNGFNQTAGAVTLSSGSINGTTSTLTGSSYALQGGTVNALLGTGAITVTTGTTTLGSAGRLNSASSLAVNSGTLTLGGAESVASFTLGGGTLGGSGNTLTSTAAYDMQSGSVSAILGGSVALNKTTSGTVTFTGANSYSGATSVSLGTLNVQNTLATSGVTVSGGTLALSGSGTLGSGTVTSSGGTVDLGGASITNTLGALTGGGAVNNGTITNNGGAYDVQNGSVGAILAGTSATLTKSGTGTVTLSATNTYTGATIVSSGTLIVSGTINNSTGVTVNGGTFNYTNNTTGLATNGVTVNSGGTFKYNSTQPYSGLLTLNNGGTLGGSGNMSSTAVYLVSGSTLSPGNSPGILTTGAQTWVNGGNYNWQLFDTALAAGTGYDTTTITGSLDLSGLTAGGFNVNLWTLSSITPDTNGNALNFTNTNDYSWTIATATGGINGFNPANFTISTLANNGAGGFSNTLSAGGAFSMSVSGNDLLLNYTAVPEPATWGLLAFSLTTVLVFRRRRS